MKKILATLICAAILFSNTGPVLASDLDAVLKGIRQRYGNAIDLKADFKQETFVKTLGRKQVKQGTVMFKQPDKMRWDYSMPDKQRLLTDGFTLWVYQPDEKVVYMRKLDAINSAKVPMQILAGKIDIIIGTHRLVQKDVQFKDLGMVIIDEEQRFGVTHKERLKQLRKEVDVLTLTATPIPRTLHLSLVGVRDMSTIDTPPEERLPIKSLLSEFDDGLVRQAILRELERGGRSTLCTTV